MLDRRDAGMPSSEARDVGVSRLGSYSPIARCILMWSGDVIAIASLGSARDPTLPSVLTITAPPSKSTLSNHLTQHGLLSLFPSPASMVSRQTHEPHELRGREEASQQSQMSAQYLIIAQAGLQHGNAPDWTGQPFKMG